MMTSTEQQVDRLLATLETITEQVIQVLVSHRPEELEPLVIDQCRYLRELQLLPNDMIDITRIQHLHERVQHQQTLIAQAKQVADLFLQRLNETPSFQILG